MSSAARATIGTGGMVTITKEFRWEMGHRLPGHPVCQNVHGHSYRLVVEIEGDLDEGGMVLDYGDVAEAVRPLVAELDHSFMVDPEDTLMRELLDRSGLKATRVSFRSTAENIAVWILNRIAPDLAANPRLARLAVTVHETESTSARIERTFR